MKKFTLPLVLVVGYLTCQTTLFAGTWPRFRGPNGTGIANGQNLPINFKESNILWKTALPGLGNSSPVVWDDHLFVLSATPDERMLLCIDVKSGKINWTRSTPGSKAHTHPNNTLASSTPATDGEAVYVSFWDGKEVFLAAYTFKGDRLWNRNLGEFVSQHGPGASPIVYKDKVILANDMDKERELNAKIKKDKRPVLNPSTLIALDKKTGEIVWKAPREAYRACYTPPFLLKKASGTELIVTSTTAITSYNPDTGSQNWEWHWKFTGKMPLRTIGTTIHLDGMLFAVSGDGGGDRHMSAIDINGGKASTVWENKKDFPYVPCLLSKGEHIYFVNDLGFAGCYHAKTGKRIWFERIPEAKFHSSPVLVDGKIYACSEQGDVYVFAAEPEFKLLAQNNLGEQIRASTAVCDGRLYVRSQKHLFCIGNAK